MVIEVITMHEMKNEANDAETPNTKHGASIIQSPWKRLLKRKWIFPAVYVVVATMILGVMWVFQNDSLKNMKVEALPTTATDQMMEYKKTIIHDAVPVMSNSETMGWPVDDNERITMVTPFYDSHASHESRQAAMMEYKDILTPHAGIDFRDKQGQSFDVKAVQDGKVSAIENHPVVGQFVEITHSNGYVSIYKSITDIKVSKHDIVKKGEVIARAGRNELEKPQGVHLHFEIRELEGGTALNPESTLK